MPFISPSRPPCRIQPDREIGRVCVCERETGSPRERKGTPNRRSSFPHSPCSSSPPSPPHDELAMAPHVGFDTEQIKDKARKDLLYLLEGVSKASSCRHGRQQTCNPPLHRRSAARRTSCWNEAWPAPSAPSSKSRRSRTTALTSSSSWRTTMPTPASVTLSSWHGANAPAMPRPSQVCNPGAILIRHCARALRAGHCEGPPPVLSLTSPPDA